MFDIGQHLFEQRRRLGLTLDECEAATRIRGRHLMALEAGRPQDIPDPAYARLFLRGYAAHLGLDADAIVAEYDEQRGAAPPLEEHRLVGVEADPAGRLGELRRWVVRPRRRSRRRELGWIAVGLLGTLAAVVWMGARDGSPAPREPPQAAAPAPSRPAAGAARPAAAPAPARGPVGLALTGGGTAGSWVQVRRGGPAGAVAYEGTVAPGRRVRVAVTGPLWMRVGWAPSLRVALGGRAVALPGGTGDFVVTRTGVAPAAR